MFFSPERWVFLSAVLTLTASAAVFFAAPEFVAQRRSSDFLIVAGAASCLTLGILAVRFAVVELADTRCRQVFEFFHEFSLSSTVLVDPNGAIFQSNERYRSGHHLPKSSDFVTALSAVVRDPIAEMRTLHQHCDLNGQIEEVFEDGPIPLSVCVRRTRNGMYLWEMSDAPMIWARTTHANQIPVAHFDADGVFHSCNNTFEQTFPNGPTGLSDVLGSLNNRQDQSVMLNTPLRKCMYDAKYVLEPDKSGALFLFERPVMEQSQKLPN
ncbi:MAG: hypothetical protein AAF386_09940, partial [Pseudomonadota bacterium]